MHHADPPTPPNPHNDNLCSGPVRDLSHTSVSISPADYNSWHDARTELMAEAKAGLKARVEAELAVAADDAVLQSLRDKFAAEERALEHEIDHKVFTFSTALDVEYNVRIMPFSNRAPFSSAPLASAVPFEVRSPTTSAGAPARAQSACAKLRHGLCLFAKRGPECRGVASCGRVSVEYKKHTRFPQRCPTGSRTSTGTRRRRRRR